MKWSKWLISSALGITCLTVVDSLPVQASDVNAAVQRTSGQDNTADTKLLEELQRTLGRAPVDAKVDRVWHAVPGLCGWNLNIEESLKKSAKQPDGALRLVWESAPPQTRLASLPAEPIYRGPQEEKSVALMFNVAWGEAELPSIVSTLDKYHVKATFFLDGDWVKKNPTLVRDLAEDGQALGSHGTGHPDFRRLSDDALMRQITETNERIKHTIGRDIHLLAPPAGAFDDRAVRFARQHSMYTILWTVDTIDWNRPPANVIVKRVMSRVEPGSFVLMHPTPSTAAALPVLIERLSEQGYRFKTVEDVVEERPATTPPQTLRRQS